MLSIYYTIALCLQTRYFLWLIWINLRGVSLVMLKWFTVWFFGAAAQVSR